MYDMYVSYLQKADLSWAKFYFFHKHFSKYFMPKKKSYGNKTLKKLQSFQGRDGWGAARERVLVERGGFF